MLTGLKRLVVETAVGTEYVDRPGTGQDIQDVSQKLAVRQAAAGLAYRLFTHYQAQGQPVPGALATWESVCGSEGRIPRRQERVDCA